MADQHRRIRRGPSISEIARVSGVGTATVDRVLNGRGQVTPATQSRVLEALQALQTPHRERKRRILVLCESGDSFNRSLREAVAAVARRRQDLDLDVQTHLSVDVQVLALAQQIERLSEGADGLVLIAREDPAIVRAARAVKRRGTPVICLATDLPVGCRHAYVGSDEYSAGAAAAGLMGDLIGPGGGDILFLVCADYHAAKEREAGFRAVLATRPGLAIASRIDVRNDPAISRASVLDHIARHGVPAGIYSIAGGNRGVGEALLACGMTGKVVFIGHELNANARALLKSGAMTYLITRDQEQEVMLALAALDNILADRPFARREERQVRILSSHLCGA